MRRNEHVGRRMGWMAGPLMWALIAGLPAALAAGVAGPLDTGFGSGGVAYLDATGAVAVQSNGKTILAGTDVGSSLARWRIQRLNADGSLDTSFGSAGSVLLFGDHANDELLHMVVDASDRVVATGQVRVAITSGRGKKLRTSYFERLTVVRLTSGGALDTGFGSGGIVPTEIPDAGDGQARGDAVAVQSNGQIVVAGTAFQVASSSGGGGGGKGKKGGGSTSTSNAICVLRYDASGDLDTSFGTDGITVNDATSGSDSPFRGAIGIQSSGEIVVGGDLNGPPGGEQWALTRYDAVGAIDTAFGQVTLSGHSLAGLAIDGSDRIVATGNRLGDLVVVRHLADGSLDNTFGSAGVSTVSFSTPSWGSAVAIQADGKIVVAADVGDGTVDLTLRPLRFDTNGSLDTGFGIAGEGEALQSSGTDHGSRWGIAIDGNGDILLSAYQWDDVLATNDWLVARWCGS